MRTITATTEADVLAALAAGRDLASGSGPWTLEFVRQATTQFQQRWTVVDLDADEAGRILLPPHAGEPCRGDRLSLVPAEGLTVNEAARRLEELGRAYADANPTCWSRIAAASADPAWSTIIVTGAPLDHDDYRGLPRARGRLYHLDGFHRLLGWTLDGRMTGDARIRAYLAGDPGAHG